MMTKGLKYCAPRVCVMHDVINRTVFYRCILYPFWILISFIYFQHLTIATFILVVESGIHRVRWHSIQMEYSIQKPDVYVSLDSMKMVPYMQMELHRRWIHITCMRIVRLTSSMVYITIHTVQTSMYQMVMKRISGLHREVYVYM